MSHEREREREHKYVRIFQTRNYCVERLYYLLQINITYIIDGRNIRSRFDYPDHRLLYALEEINSG